MLKKISAGVICSLILSFRCSGDPIQPIPAAQQAGMALRILENYESSHGASPSNHLCVVYYTPADRDPLPDYQQRLGMVLKEIHGFYSEQMCLRGFTNRCFQLESNSKQEVIIHLVKGVHSQTDCLKHWNAHSRFILDECRLALKSVGITLENETAIVFCNVGDWDKQRRRLKEPKLSPGSWTDTGGICWLVDSPLLDANSSSNTTLINDTQLGEIPFNKRSAMLMGAVAHELGNALGLPRSGERWDEQPLGKSIMGPGARFYHTDIPVFLTLGNAMRLAARPLFKRSADKKVEPGRLPHCEIILSTNLSSPALATRPAGLRIEGKVTGSTPVYAVIGYFDDRGSAEPTATTVPDADGRYALEVSDLEPCAEGHLRLEYCHANGAISERTLGFTVGIDGEVDVSQWQVRRDLKSLASAVWATNLPAAERELRHIEKKDASALTKDIARHLVDTLKNTPKAAPSEAGADVKTLPLGDARIKEATLKWLTPSANRIPHNDEVKSPLLDAGELHATGLYAHAPSIYYYDLGGKWQSLHGKGGLHVNFQKRGTVVFLIIGDGKELYRSDVIRRTEKADFTVNVAGVKELELIVEQPEARNGGNWALWLDPTLTR